LNLSFVSSDLRLFQQWSFIFWSSELWHQSCE